VTALPPNTELLVAVHHFLADAKAGRARLEVAVLLPVTGELYLRLRAASRNSLAAPPGDRHLVSAALGELVATIGRDVKRRQEALRGDPMPEPVRRQPAWLPYADN
jgi:hypothetical protein